MLLSGCPKMKLPAAANSAMLSDVVAKRCSGTTSEVARSWRRRRISVNSRVVSSAEETTRTPGPRALRMGPASNGKCVHPSTTVSIFASSSGLMVRATSARTAGVSKTSPSSSQVSCRWAPVASSPSTMSTKLDAGHPWTSTPASSARMARA